ncbi:PepSY domain-containing protein [Symbioplanes lichenis]|uniref:PepSY domain-containing protein n=1 Tax=Symbioplanes lichenis TaxID=1629072 RepID=UPI002739C98C|nr:PepSY domain-containing protein [Actinoplanes lichenis]
MNKRIAAVLTGGAFALTASLGLATAASATPGPGDTPSPTPSVSPSAPDVPGTDLPALPGTSGTPVTPGVPTAPGGGAPGVPAGPAIITADEAKAIALTASGGGTITKFELKDENSDHPEYRAEIRNGRTEHKLRIDARTGVITRHDIKN